MPQSDDKPRGKGAREASQLRATLGSEPSSGYAFHDHVRVDRVERVRPGARDNNAPQAASHAPRERAFARTLVGGVTIQEALEAASPARESGAAPANDQREAPDHVSWPPMPQVPNDLEGSLLEVEAPTGVRMSMVSTEPPAKLLSTDPPAQPVSAAPPMIPAGGAIWQAMPSLVSTSVVPEAIEGRDSTPTRETPISAKRNGRPATNSRPAGFRPSAAELEADHAHTYGDQRVLKYEALVERNAWEQLADELGREQDPSPALLLLRVVAQREVLKGEQKQEAARLAQQGISAMAKLLGLPEASPTALVLGKRLLRRNPGWVAKRQASAGLSVGLLLGGIGAGAAIGWLITTLLF